MAESIELPEDWARTVSRIRSGPSRKVLVLGAADRGKSTYCRFLCGELASKGGEVAFVDADIGQKDVGPPAAVSLARVTERGFELQSLYFVGATNPAGHFLPLVVGTRRMATAAPEGAFIVIDTTGLVHHIGYPLKFFQIESLEPDLIVAIQRKRELEPILQACRHRNIVRLTSSPFARRKSERERRQVREEAFLDHFRSARDVMLPLERLSVERSLLFNGEPVSVPGFALSERFPDGVAGIVGQDHRGRSAPVRWALRPGFEVNLLAAVGDGENTLALARVLSFDLDNHRVTLRTPAPPEAIRTLQLGTLYVDEHGREGGELRGRLPWF